jgi:rhodanese-related sulfurtransferase
MNVGHYVYIDEEYHECKIIDVRHPKETLKEKAIRQGYFNKSTEQKIKEMNEFLNNPNRLQLDSDIMFEELARIRGKDINHYKD